MDELNLEQGQETTTEVPVVEKPVGVGVRRGKVLIGAYVDEDLASVFKAKLEGKRVSVWVREMVKRYVDESVVQCEPSREES